MNELIFFFHSLTVAVLALGALRLGKEALISWICLQAVLANFFVTKQMELFGLTVTCSDVYAIGSILGLNLLQEAHGKAEAARVVRVAFFSMLCFVLMSHLHLAYRPSAYDQTHNAFLAVLSNTPRILGASFVVFYLVQRWDIWFFAQLKSRLPDWPLWARTGTSLVVAQLLDTVLFSYLGLYGMVASLTNIIIFSYFTKLLVIGATGPFTALSRRVLTSPQEASS